MNCLVFRIPLQAPYLAVCSCVCRTCYQYVSPKCSANNCTSKTCHHRCVDVAHLRTDNTHLIKTNFHAPQRTKQRHTESEREREIWRQHCNCNSTCTRHQSGILPCIYSLSPTNCHTTCARHVTRYVRAPLGCHAMVCSSPQTGPCHRCCWSRGRRLCVLRDVCRRRRLKTATRAEPKRGKEKNTHADARTHNGRALA